MSIWSLGSLLGSQLSRALERGDLSAAPPARSHLPHLSSRERDTVYLTQLWLSPPQKQHPQPHA